MIASILCNVFLEYLIVGVVSIAIGSIILLISNRLHAVSDQKIIEAEQKRKQYPDIQSGKFTRLYTMPYDEDLTPEKVCDYAKELYPNYVSMVTGKNSVRVMEHVAVLGHEVRDLVFHHLERENITAIEFIDPQEIERDGQRGTSHMRSSLDDRGFGEDIRKIVRHFQEQAIAHNKRP